MKVRMLHTTLMALLAGAVPVGSQAHAAGFGSAATGGQGGRIIEVTNLKDVGAGSLRACVDASGPRICRFRVAGTIKVAKSLDVDNGRLTIDGGSTPDGGIEITLTPDSSEGGALLSIGADNVIVRHLRLRRGPTSLKAKPGGTCCGDVIGLNGASRVMLDHLSLAFSTDELFDVYQSRDVTLQNSILSYALARSTDKDSLRTGKSHSKGMLSGYSSDRVSFLNNVVAMVEGRGCRFKSGSRNDCRGNYFHGMKQSEAILSDGAKVNIVRNAFRRPADQRGTAKDVIDTRGGAAAYASGNDLPGDRRLWAKGASRLGGPVPSGDVSGVAPGGSILATAGAMPRDALDAQVIAHVRAGTGSIIDDPSQVDWTAGGNGGTSGGSSGGESSNEPGISRELLAELRDTYDDARKAAKAHRKLKKDYRARGKDREWKDEYKALRRAERAAKDAYYEAKAAS